VAVLLHSQRFNRNGTRRVAVHVQCRVYTSSPLPVKVVETVGGGEVLQRTYMHLAAM
jgi:hypothetical protein